MSRETKLAKNTFILAIGTFLPRLASFVVLPILTGCLTQAEYGTYDLITVLVSLILPSATLQIQTAAFRYLIDQRHDVVETRKIITNIFAFIIPVSAAALVILYFCLFSLDPFIRIMICLYFMIDILVSAMRQVIRGLSKNMIFSISAIISALCKMILAILCVYIGRMGLYGALIALTAAEALSLCFMLYKVHFFSYFDLHLISAGKIKELLSYSWPMVPNSMSMWVMRVSDRFVVTLFMGVSANAVYSVANKIPQLLTIAQNTFTMAWQENASIYSKDNDAAEYYSAMFSTMYDLMAGFMGLLIAMTPVLFVILIRGDYSAAYYQIPVLFMGMFFFSMSAYLGGIYVAYMKTKSVGITTMAAAACNLVTDLAAIHFIGLYAASGSTLISYLFLFLFRMFDVRKIVRLEYNYKRLLVVFCILIAECVLCYMRNPVCNLINVIFGLIVFFLLNRSIVKVLWKKGRKLLRKRK